MEFEFNLLDEPWIPCVGVDGRSAELGLRETLARAHELREIAGESPLVTAALHRLVLAVLHRVYGPEGYDAWSALWGAGKWDMAQLDAYLDEWRHRFDLFDQEHPFYQATDDRVRPKPINSLILDLAFGNKATLFDHHVDAEAVALAPAEAACALVVAQCFGLAGLSGLPQKFTDSTCTRGVIFLVEGDTLFETLLLNMLCYPTADDIMPHSPGDCPVWEIDNPFVPDRSVPRGYLDYLTWQNRRVLLIPEDTPDGPVVRQMTVAPGLRLAGEAMTRDPMKHYRVDQKRGLLVRRFSESRALWRDSAALFSLRTDDHRPPRTFQWLSELVDEGHLDVGLTRRYVALGMANNQAKVDFYRAECMPLPLKYLTDDALVSRLHEALTMAEGVRGQLWGATRTLAKFVLSPQADREDGHSPDGDDMRRLADQWAVEREYWSRLELPFRRLLEGLPDDIEGTLTEWREILRRTAWSALDRVSAELEHDPHRLKATVHARDQLAIGLARVLPA